MGEEEDEGQKWKWSRMLCHSTYQVARRARHGLSSRADSAHHVVSAVPATRQAALASIPAFLQTPGSHAGLLVSAPRRRDRKEDDGEDIGMLSLSSTSAVPVLLMEKSKLHTDLMI